MRSDPGDFELVAPGSLQGAVALLARNPGEWLPLAGGTDLMVLYAAGKLPARKLVSIWNLPELRRIEVRANEINVGAGSTFTDIRKHEIIAREFPMLARAAGWTGGIANQNRGTLGGNIVNASPAADSLPALLAYDAELILTSVRGQRRFSYAEFHTGYKKTKLAPDELIQAICLPRCFSGYVSHARKVGSRNAQAISKVCIASLGRIANPDGSRIIEEIRIAVGSVAPVPLRLGETEKVVTGKKLDLSLISLARRTAAAEVRPIDDIRSTAKYRAAVAGNLVAEFLKLLNSDTKTIGHVLARWNVASEDEAAAQILRGCGSRAWAREMTARRPFQDENALESAADEIWDRLTEADWLEAFRSHPRIGESKAANPEAQAAEAWANQEQRQVADADDAVKIALAERNREYERKFGYIYIVCATGKSAAEMLQILDRRLQNDAATELREAAEQQRQITHIRLKKWLS
ncbi:MAG: 2-oxo-4-hydroxy-4-carboxy-5-ureidoimidazoline decarboxylase [Candidatus Sulfotelmatobacter sp.]|jgi:OHCU decarboxylase